MTPTPLENMPERVREEDHRLERVRVESTLGVVLWMTEDTIGEPGAGAWADETDLYGVLVPIAERLRWLRLETHEEWIRRGGR